MTTGHADSHDLGKLARWYDSLSTDDSGGIPAHALMLVSAGDRAAHDVFRHFRSSFEARGAGFCHLVIFGQHGVSTTVRGLLPEFGLDAASVPLLVLFAGPSAATVYAVPLPGGEEESDSRWREVLAKVELAADMGGGDLDLASLPEATGHPLGNASLVGLVGKALKGLT